MRQDWKTLGIVALGAALAGWLVVRAMNATPPEHPQRTAPPASVPGAAATSVAAVEEAPVPPIAPAEPAATPAAAGTTHDAAIDVDAIVRDLEILSQALAQNQRLEDRVLPRINDALDVPGITAYRRAPDFWEPALAGSEGASQ